MIPSQKPGMLWPSSATLMARLSAAEYGLSAETIPSGDRDQQRRATSEAGRG